MEFLFLIIVMLLIRLIEFFNIIHFLLFEIENVLVTHHNNVSEITFFLELISYIKYTILFLKIKGSNNSFQNPFIKIKIKNNFFIFHDH